MTNVMDEIKAVLKRNREDYEALAQMTGKTIAEIEADTTAPDPGKRALNKLSDRMSVEFDGGNVILYDIRACSTKRIVAITTAAEMEALWALYTDGCCPVCLKEIPLYDIVCDECLENARNMRHLAR